MTLREFIRAIGNAKQQNPQFDFNEFTLKVDGVDPAMWHINVQDFTIRIFSKEPDAPDPEPAEVE